MSSCPNFNAVLTTNDDENNMLVARARCKMWSCTHCAEINRKQWRLRIFKAQEELGDKWAFITLTAHSRAKTASSSLSNLQEGWNKLRARMRREYGKYAYVRVYELHRDGRWHFHALVNFHFDDIAVRKQRDGKEVQYSRWMKKNAQECSLGWYTHAENMRSVAGAAKYVTKYMSKSLESLPKGVRRIQTSQGFPALENDAKYDWKLERGVYYSDLIEVWERGGNIIDISEKHTLTLDDYLNDYIYPPGWICSSGGG